MELLQTILGIVVAVGVIIGYLKGTLSTMIHAIVDNMFLEHKQNVNQLFNEHKLLIDRQTQTLGMLDKAISKLTSAVDKIGDQQHAVDKELAILTRDIEMIRCRLDDHDSKLNRVIHE